MNGCDRLAVPQSSETAGRRPARPIAGAGGAAERPARWRGTTACSWLPKLLRIRPGGKDEQLSRGSEEARAQREVLRQLREAALAAGSQFGNDNRVDKKE